MGIWRAKIKINKHDAYDTHLGYYNNEKEAALAYDAAAKQHFGEFALTNF